MQQQHKRYVTAAQLRQRYGGVSHMWIERRLRRDPDFPRPRKFGSSPIRMWDVGEIELWERRCAAKTHCENATGERPGGDPR